MIFEYRVVRKDAKGSCKAVNHRVVKEGSYKLPAQMHFWQSVLLFLSARNLFRLNLILPRCQISTYSKFPPHIWALQCCSTVIVSVVWRAKQGYQHNVAP